jgi:hypothetical protein
MRERKRRREAVRAVATGVALFCGFTCYILLVQAGMRGLVAGTLGLAVALLLRLALGVLARKSMLCEAASHRGRHITPAPRRTSRPPRRRAAGD